MKMRMFNRKKLLLMLACMHVLALAIALAPPNIVRTQLADDSSWTWTELVSEDFWGWSSLPSLDVGPDGTVHIAWQDSPDLFDTEIYYKRWVPDTGWTETEVISNDTESGRSSSPSLAVGPKGTVHIAWDDYTDYGDSGSDTDIFYKRLDPGYTRWTTTKVISTESTSASGLPSLAVGSDGRVYIAWEDYTDIKGSGSDADIFLKVTDVFPWNGVVAVVSTESTGDSHNPSLAVGPFGTVHIAWDDVTNYDDSGDDRDIFYKMYIPYRTDWTTTETEVVSTESDGNSFRPSLDTDGLGYPSIAWEDLTDYDDSGIDRDIFYKQLVRDQIFPPGPPFWTPTEVVSTESTGPSFFPSLDVGSDFRKHITWTEVLGDYLNSPSDILYAVPGTGWTTTERVSPEDTYWPGEKEVSEWSSLAVDADGTVHIAWGDQSPIVPLSGTDQDVFYRKRVHIDKLRIKTIKNPDDQLSAMLTEVGVVLTDITRMDIVNTLGSQGFTITSALGLYNAFNPSLRGIVNSPGYGSNNGWTHLNMRWAHPGVERFEDGHTIIEWITGDEPELLNPCSASTVYAWDIIGKTQDGLIGMDPYTHRDIPWLADSWSIVVDSPLPGQMEVTFNLRSDVYWQDGNPFTPSDVVFNWLFLRDNAIPRYMGMWQFLVNAVVIGPNTVKAVMSTTDQLLIYDLAGTAALLPPNVWGPLNGQPLTTIMEYDPSTDTDWWSMGPWFRTGPEFPDNRLFGTGPFVFDEYDPLIMVADLHRSASYFLATDEISNMKTEMFHWVGDVNSDGIINILDLATAAQSFGKQFGDPDYNGDADISPEPTYHTNDGRVNIRDIAEIARNWGKQKEYP